MLAWRGFYGGGNLNVRTAFFQSILSRISGGEVEVLDEFEVGGHSADGPVGSVEEGFGFSNIEGHLFELLAHEPFEV